MRLRWLWSLLIWFILTTSVVATVGFASTGNPEGAPDTFATPASHPGDRAVYKSALVVVEGDEGQWFDLNARYAFERVSNRIVSDSEGWPTIAQSFVSEWAVGPFDFYILDFLSLTMPPCLGPLLGIEEPMDLFTGEFEPDESRWEDMGPGEAMAFAFEMESCVEEIEQWAEQLEDQLEFLEMMSVWEDHTHVVSASDWHVSHADEFGNIVSSSFKALDAYGLSGFVSGLPADTIWTVPEPSEAPCGFMHDMQNQTTDIWSEITVHGACPPRMDFGFARTSPLAGSYQLKIAGEETIDGKDTTVFAHSQDPDLLRLWFADDVAYPVRILSEIDVVPPQWLPYANNGNPPRFYIMQELIDGQAGQAEQPPTNPILDPVYGVRMPWGPSDTGVAHQWPLSTAYRQSVSVPNSPLGDWLRDHPDAALDAAKFDAGPSWQFSLVDGNSGLQVSAKLTDNGSNVTASEFIANGRPDDTDQPKQLASISSLSKRHTALTGGDVSGWEFTASCGASCNSVHFRTAIGTREAWGDTSTQLSIFDGDGTPLGQADNPSPYPEPRFADDAWNPSEAENGWTWDVASAGVWAWPEPITAARVAAATGLISLLYLVWPVIKGASALPLFSRIKSEDLLEHPVRSDMFQVIEENPGIHFQEIVRRIAKGRGTTEHHIRKLVSAGLLVEKADRGFTCYFPKGKIDRHLMAAAPVLKTPGARQVLQAIKSQPGGVSADIAAKLGMAPSTVNYHLKKLVAAELVETNKQGRFLALHATNLGDQALGTFRT